jgi:hypothetical protein
MDQVRPQSGKLALRPRIRRLADLILTHSIRRRPRADPVQKQVPGERMTSQGLTCRGPLQKPGLSGAKSGAHRRLTAIQDFAPLNPGYVAQVRRCAGRKVEDNFQLSGETAGDLFARRKATGRLLRERKPAVDANFEDAAARPPQVYLRRWSQLGDQFPRLTGARFVASLTAIFDLDVHDFVLSA